MHEGKCCGKSLTKELEDYHKKSQKSSKAFKFIQAKAYSSPGLRIRLFSIKDGSEFLFVLGRICTRDFLRRSDRKPRIWILFFLAGRIRIRVNFSESAIATATVKIVINSYLKFLIKISQLNL